MQALQFTFLTIKGFQQSKSDYPSSTACIKNSETRLKNTASCKKRLKSSRIEKH